MVVCQWIMLLSNVFLMILTGKMISRVFYGQDWTKDAIRLAGVLLVVLIIRGSLSFASNRLSFETSRQLKERLRTLIFEKLIRMKENGRGGLALGEIVQVSTEGVEQLEIYFGKYVPQFFYSMLAPLTLFAVASTMSVKVAVVLLLCVPLIPISIAAVQKFAKKMLARYWGTYTKLGDSFLECLQGLTTLKIFQADERYGVKMDEESEEFRKVTMRVLIMQLNSISIMDLVAYGGTGLGIILSIMELQKGNIVLWQCFFLIMIGAEFFLPLRLLGSFFHIAMNGNAAADKIFRFLDQEEPKPGAVTEAELIKGSTVTLKDVSFSYNGGCQVLDHVTIEAGKGLTALAGESGCGKSTVTSLIMGNIKESRGSVKIGELFVEDIHTDTLYQKVTRICHDSYLFAGTVRENLLMGRKDAGEDEMYEALRKVNLDEFVRSQGGLDLELLEGASNLSGGQRQRLSIARALLHDSDIYIFDEAASNVDVESENDIMSAVKKLAEIKTVILISHRLLNIVDAKKIYVLKNGKIIESGTHRQLYEGKGYYHNLFHKQEVLESYGRREACS